jgi:ribonuclease HI
VALPDDLQLHRRLPPRHPHHPGDPGGLRPDARGRRAGAGAPPRPGVGGLTDQLALELGDDRRAAARERPGRRATRSRGYVIRTDGAARGNPGPASLGAALFRLDRPDARDPLARPDATISEYLGVQTNNVAEYTGVLRAVELARDLGAEQVELLLDSNLIVEQLHGRWRVKDAKLRPLWSEILRVLRALPGGWQASHVRRAQNTIADGLANEAIDRVAAGGPPVVVRRS